MVNEIQFVKGRWYAHNPYNDLNKLWYIKYAETNNWNNKIASEYINDFGTYNNARGTFSANKKEYLYEINDLSQIAHLLPKNHPDLIISNPLNNLELW